MCTTNTYTNTIYLRILRTEIYFQFNSLDEEFQLITNIV